MNKNLIIIDAGHGGIDSGAVGNNLLEKNLTLQASEYMHSRFNELGIPSVLVRQIDEYLPKIDRINRINDIVSDNPNTNIILLSNHINAGNGEGAEVVYSLKNDNTLADLILFNIGEKGQIERKSYQRRLPENPNKDYYYILRETNTNEPLLIEYGFIDNNNDSEKLKNNLEDYVEGVVKAISEYLNYNYIYNEDKKQDSYIVEKGDTLYSISRKFDITVDELKRINNLINNNLSIGQVLYLKENIISNKDTYIVKKGDTLYSISKLFNISIEDLKKENNLQSNILTIGEELFIPKENTFVPEEIDYNDYMIYKVEKGDSLWNISKKFNIDIDELIALNNLQDLTIKLGQELLVPKQVIENEYYIVQKGDTLWSISKEYNISIDKLKELNNLKTNLLSIGQKLIVK